MLEIKNDEGGGISRNKKICWLYSGHLMTSSFDF